MFARLFRRSRRDAERAEEMQRHLDLQIRELIEDGASPAEARREALRRFGNPRALREELHDMNGLALIDTIGRDARYAVRVLLKSPGFTITAVFTLAIAIGINTAVFSVVDGVLLKPLPYPEPDRLGLVATTIGGDGPEREETSQTGRTWQIVRDHASTVDAAVFSGWPTGVNVVADGRASHVRQQRVGAGFFDVLGIRPALGRGFTEEEDRTGGPAAAVLSDELWQSMFNRDPSVIGKVVVLRGEAATVVGVMPAAFESGYEADLWTPLRAGVEGEGEGENYRILLRLKPGVTWAQAASEIRTLAAPLVEQQASRPVRALRFGVAPLQPALTEGLRRPLLMLWCAVAVVLLVACVNLAGLLLARASGRTREIATRMALGSGRAAVIRQLVIESIVLALAGGALGVMLGAVALDRLVSLAQGSLDIWQPVALDGRAIAVAASLSLVACACFGLAPAIQASRLDLQAGLIDAGARSIAGRSTRWPRRIIVTAQVALGVVLLVGAGLLVRTFNHVRGLEPGFDPRGVIAASVSLQDARYRTAQSVTQLFDRTLERMRALPGTDSAGVALGLPYQRLLNLGFRRVDGAQTSGMTSAAYVTPGYFEAIGIPLRRGRGFAERDSMSAPGVVLISETFARTYFADEEPVGRRILFAGREREIVGLVGDVQVKPGWGDNGPLAAMPLAYIPVAQANEAMLRLVHGWFSPVFVVRSQATPVTQSALRAALDQVDPLLPFADVQSMVDVQAAAIAPQRFLMAVLLTLAATAVLLAAVGIHGLIATSVTERTREIGIRIALGATTSQSVRSLVVPGVALAAAGVLIGSAVSLVFARLLRTLVWGVTTSDPLTFAGVALLLLAVATAASVIPALRIVGMDPAATLRRH